MLLVAQSITCILILSKHVYSSLQTYPYPSEEDSSTQLPVIPTTRHTELLPIVQSTKFFPTPVYLHMLYPLLLMHFPNKETFNHPFRFSLNPAPSLKFSS